MATERKFLSSAVFILLFSVAAKAQVIPSSKTVNWSYAGYKGTVASGIPVVDITVYGGNGNGTANNSAAFSLALAALSNQRGVIYFPAGNYIFNSPLVLKDSVIIRGAGSSLTTLSFNFNGTNAHCIQVNKSNSNAFMPVVSGYMKGSYKIIVQHNGTLKKNNFIEIRQANGAWDTKPAAWAQHCVGQIARISMVKGDTVTLYHELRIDYSASLNPEVRKISVIKEAGIECLKMQRIDNASGLNYGIFFSYAWNCWISGIESFKSIGSHVFVNSSSNISISGSYFHESWGYDGSGTRGYGVSFAERTGECVAENNIFRKLRHAMVCKQGANGNVMAYNYSREPNRMEFPSDAGADLFCHGHFAYANLFEGNICQTIQVDQSWGPSGPWNTFFRNRVELYGIIISSGTVNSNEQNFVGNDVVNTGFLKGLYTLAGSNHFEYCNRVKGNFIPSQLPLPDVSYYLQGQPSFWNGGNFPSVGYAVSLTGQTNPARDRYFNSNFTQCNVSPRVAEPESINNTIKGEGFEVIAFPNPFNDELKLLMQSEKEVEVRVLISDMNGRKMFERVMTGGKREELLNTQNFNAGVYLLHVTANGEITISKILHH